MCQQLTGTVSLGPTFGAGVGVTRRPYYLFVCWLAGISQVFFARGGQFRASRKREIAVTATKLD